MPPDRNPVDHRDDQIEPDQKEEEVEPRSPVDRRPGDLPALSGLDDGSERHDAGPAQQKTDGELDLPEEAEKAGERARGRSWQCSLE